MEDSGVVGRWRLRLIAPGEEDRLDQVEPWGGDKSWWEDRGGRWDASGRLGDGGHTETGWGAGWGRCSGQVGTQWE